MQSCPLATRAPPSSLRTRTANRATAAQPAPGPKSSWAWLGYVTAVLAALTSVVSLFGYGVLMGLGSVFHLDHNLFISSPLDVLLSAWVGFSTLVPKALSWSSVWAGYRQLALGAILLAVLSALLIAWIWFAGPRGVGAGAFSEIVRPALRRQLARPRGKERLMTQMVLGVVSGTLLVVPLLIWAALGLALWAVALAPAVGISAAMDFSHRHVLPMSACSSGSISATSSVKTLPCVTIEQSDKSTTTVKTGYIVVATSSSALLYDPVTRLAERVPVANAVIRSSAPASQATTP